MYFAILGNAFADQDKKPAISQTVVKSLFARGQEALPIEYSALLAGVNNTIITYLPGERRDHTTLSFSWSGPALLAALSSMRTQGLIWLGVFHTHPRTPAIPSSADAGGWHYPSLGYWIMSLAEHEPRLALYQWTDGRFVPRAYDIVEP
jgi:proteasome lid subunit RPN8/RPN11